MIPALIPSCSAWLPSVAETWVSLISFRLIGRAPICSIVASSCASLRLLKPPEICAPGATVDPVGVFGEVDDRPRFDFVVEDDGEVAGERACLLGADRPDRLRLAPLGDPAGDVLEGFPALVGEAEGDDRLRRIRR